MTKTFCDHCNRETNETNFQEVFCSSLLSARVPLVVVTLTITAANSGMQTTPDLCIPCQIRVLHQAYAEWLRKHRRFDEAAVVEAFKEPS